jgi:hypothetical protein
MRANGLAAVQRLANAPANCPTKWISVICDTLWQSPKSRT